jgi:hypothetical protein
MNPNMIHQIFMEGEVGCPVSNLMICMEKLLKEAGTGFVAANSP